MAVTRNSKVLTDFCKYCEEHPDERFWQALRNWSGYGKIFVTPIGDPMNFINTYSWEGRQKQDST